MRVRSDRKWVEVLLLLGGPPKMAADCVVLMRGSVLS